jgi:DNA-binding NtrC family response regulator
MSRQELRKRKRILAVDDEPDIIEVIREQLEAYEVVAATNFDTAHKLILSEHFDLAILDIMGVNGFALLDTCGVRKLPAAMLTAHALNVASLNLAMKLGATTFLPKDELANLKVYVAEIFECLEQGNTHWEKLFERLGPLFKERLGMEWGDLEAQTHHPASG